MRERFNDITEDFDEGLAYDDLPDYLTEGVGRVEFVKKGRRIPVFGNPFKRNQITGWVRVADSDDGQEMPNTLPDGTPLRSRSEKMRDDFEGAGKPTKGSQPKSDFETSDD